MIEKLNEIYRAPVSTKTRSILIIIVIILLIAIVIGYLTFLRAVKDEAPDVTEVAKPPPVRAIPGVGKEPTREYLRLQEQVTRKEAEEALRKKGVALPPLVRATYLGEGEFRLPTAKPGEILAGCSVDELRRARKAGVSAFELRCRGCSAAALKAAGYTAGELRNAGFTAKQLKDAGFSAAELKGAGFGANELKAAGFNAGELKAAGFSDAEITKPAKKKDCSALALSKARAKGVSAAEFKECGAAALKAAGFTAQELKDAGFSAGELRAAGFSVNDLKDAGFNARALRDAGFSAEELKNVGLSPKELKAAEFTDGDLVRAGFSAAEITPKPEVAPKPTEPPVSVLAPAPDREKADIQAELARLREQQAKQMSQQEWQNKMQELQQNMSTQAGDLFASWTPLPKQQFVEGQKEKAVAGAAVSKQAEPAAGKKAVSGDVLKAGTIIFAVLNTGINSDEKSPIMATVTQGKLKGAKVLGNFKREGKKVVLQFNLLSVPYLDHSIGINAYAVDPEIGRIAMASSVDNHYLYRYGTLFASSFLGGLGKAVQYSGSSIIQSGEGGSVSIAYKDLNAGELALSGLGDVGTKFSDVIAKDFDMPPTVRVKAGSGIGLLLMSDLTIPKG
jgi:intracellular multiplication protein IcmE